MKELAPHQLRVIEEKEQLDDRVSKLTAFIESDRVNLLPVKDKELLERQLVVMTSYSDILRDRIALF